ncbi:MAG: cation transporter [Clostridia bacterium]|nr:cation transporter [Clostridia bacterium]
MLTNWLIRRFIRNNENTADPDVRCAYGRLAGVVGVVANVLLFVGKISVGLLGSSLAIVADAFNNLSDAGSSVVTLVGFKLASAPPDEEHPFGHGRLEYLSALTVAALIMVAGFELLTSAVDKILNPVQSAHSWVTVVLLFAAIDIKVWLAAFNRGIGKRISSQALLASATDSRNDVICTGVVLLSYLADLFFNVQIDGYVGAAVALFVLWSGFSIMRDTVSPLLGESPDPALVSRIREIVLSRDGVVGIHDLIVHNYGPGRCLVSLHAEVPAHKDILHSHELVDDIEQQLVRELHIVACIHMDPVDTLDERVGTLKVLSETVLTDIDKRLTLHDFRVVFGENRINVIFDVVVPFGYENRVALQDEVQRRLQLTDPRLHAVITTEHSYV